MFMFGCLAASQGQTSTEHVSRRVGVSLTVSIVSTKHHQALHRHDRHESLPQRPGPHALTTHASRMLLRSSALALAFAAAPRWRRTSAIRHATM